uniref:phosphatidylinositol 3-kinase n=1 Tax=Zooxanthella nutricula TaxID=1333877 RepID=A0A7S2QCL9_9DINO
MKLRDLPRESSFVVRVWTQGQPAVLHRGVLPLFSRRAVLRQGGHLLALVRVPEADAADAVGRTPRDWRTHTNEVVLQGASYELQEALRLIKARELLDRGHLPAAAAGFEECEACLERQAQEALTAAGLPWLRIHLPVFPHPVVFAEPHYDSPFDAASGALGAPLREETSRKTLAALEGPGWLLQPLKPTDGQGRTFKNFADYDAQSEHPAVLKSLRLSGASRSRAKDRDARPDADERRRLNELVLRPKRQFSAEEKQLLFRFRWSLTDNPGALTKFLHAVDWSDLEERQHAIELMGHWSPVDIDDALELLSKDFRGIAEVRRYAVERLGKANDDDVHLYLLQLVQALRYEPSSSSGAVPTTAGEEGGHAAPSPTNRAAADAQAGAAGNDLAGFLIQRAVRCRRLATSLHWYLVAEADDRERGASFDRVRQRIFEVLDETPEGRSIRRVLDRQVALRRKLLWCLRSAKAAKRERTEKKVERFRQALREEPPGTELPLDLVGGLDEGIPLPVDPRLMLWRVDPKRSSLLKSAMNPAVLTCEVGPLGGEHSERRTKKVMVKEGDDLRQDQLVLQLIILMDCILKRYGVDLQLTPYQVVALSSVDGMVEFVEDSSNISTIIKDYNGDIQQFLRAHHPHPGVAAGEYGPQNSYGIKPEVLENFIRSCAGYCVITYILGIGDRHLDNIMVTRDGCLFHIDFGFILGKDPKPLMPPMRICKEMVEGMGGFSSPGYTSFKAKCCQAYKILRRHSKLIINLLYLMVDSGIKDMIGDPQFVILKVEQKFQALLDDEQCEEHFVSLIDSSVNAILPAVFEVAHRLNVARQ